MKTKYNINSYSDLENEERRIKKRLISQEEVLKIKLKTLPEELVASGITKLVTDILNGEALRSVISVVKVIGSSFLGKSNEGEGSNVWGIIKSVIKSKL